MGLIGSSLIKFLNKSNRDIEIICVDTLNNNKKFHNIVGLDIQEFASLDDFIKSNLILKDVVHISPGACSSTLEESMEYLYNRNYRMTVNLVNDFIFLKK